ncbi:histidine phosphatase family protein [Streptomyces sp. NPDC003393]
MTKQQQIILVRHAETAWNIARRYYTGRDDPDLTAAGEREAGLLLPHLRAYRDARVLCSPALRARRTATLAGLTVDIDPGLREWSYRLPDGHTVDERCGSGPCHHDVWDAALLRDACAGECLPEVTARADRVLDRARRLMAGGRPVVLVSHGNLIRLLTARWLGLSAAAGAHLALRTASIGRLAHYDGRPSLLGWNFSPSFDARPTARSAASPGSGAPPPPPATPDGTAASASGPLVTPGGSGPRPDRGPAAPGPG